MILSTGEKFVGNWFYDEEEAEEDEDYQSVVQGNGYFYLTTGLVIVGIWDDNILKKFLYQG